MTSLKLNQPRNKSLFDTVVPNQDLLLQLVDMGFPQERASAALIAVRNQHLAAAMDWLLANPEGMDITPTTDEPKPTVPHTTTTPATPPTTTTDPSPSTSEEHLVFSRTDDRAKLAFEEKERQKRLAEAMKEKKKQEAEKKRVRQQLEEMKKDRLAKYAKPGTTTTTTTTPTSSPVKPAPSPSRTAPTEAQLQIRTPSGELLKHTFKATDTITAVAAFVSSKIHKDLSEFTLIQPFPRKEFTGELMDLTLLAADLAPRGTLTVINQEARGVVKGAEQDTVSFVRPPRRHYYDSDESSEEENPDALPEENLSYEQLLALEEKIGDVNTGATPEMIDRLPVMTYQPDLAKSSEDSCCLICQMDFNEGEEVRGLPCQHFYHKPCIDIWLQKKKTCPKCIQRIDAIQA